MCRFDKLKRGYLIRIVGYDGDSASWTVSLFVYGKVSLKLKTLLFIHLGIPVLL